MSYLVKTWFSERSGNEYRIVRTDFGELVCNCPACFNGGSCWEIRKLEADDEYVRMVNAFNNERKKQQNIGRIKQWWEEFPNELIPWNSSARVVSAWHELFQKQYCVKCY